MQTPARTNLPEMLLCKQASMLLKTRASASGGIIIASAGPGCAKTVKDRIVSSLKSLNPLTLSPHWQHYREEKTNHTASNTNVLTLKMHFK